MNILLPRDIAEVAPEALAAAGCHAIAETIERKMKRFGMPDGIEVDVLKLGDDGLDAIYTLAKASGDRSLMMLITSYRNIVAAPMKAKIGHLKTLPAGLIAFLLADAIDGWLYQRDKDGVFMPWLVRKVTFKPASQYGPAHVTMLLSANTARTSEGRKDGDVSTSQVAFYADDVAKRSLVEVLAAKDLYHETPALKAAYEEDLARFQTYRVQFGAQFSGRGHGLTSHGHRTELFELGVGSKLINDESKVNRVIVDQVDDEFWSELPGSPQFNIQPYHCRLYMFHLGVHEHFWVHVSCLEPYAYRPELRDKLVLPTLHRDLIDILTIDMDVILEDFVDGKSGGTTILCKGAPGLGKTLTAEVYAEVVQKPLYRVHSGQLGTEAAQVEAALSTILKRAERWGAVLLLDEADVFVRRRDNDIEHNAVVASFLRTLEYFHGLLFMTTNRADDIDDAILSRCIAVIKYEIPGPEDAYRLWTLLAEQFAVPLSSDLVAELVGMFKNASGRDIKELLKLTSKFTRRKGLPLDADVFRKCAMFRGMA